MLNVQKMAGKIIREYLSTLLAILFTRSSTETLCFDFFILANVAKRG